MIELDGSVGEGGGQILRSALTLSMITGIPFRMDNIRAKRKKPGLMRQHLTAVNASARICNALVEGADAGSQTLTFTPQAVEAGHFEFAIGTAGSCTLVAQTILPALMLANAPSRIVLKGGTHNPLAPSATFLQHAFLPLLKRMGVDVKLTIQRHGFFPAGGGELLFEVTPNKELTPINLLDPIGKPTFSAEAIVAGVPPHIGERELFVVGKQFGLIAEHVRELDACKGTEEVAAYHRLFLSDGSLRVLNIDKGQGPGNALSIMIKREVAREVGEGEHSPDHRFERPFQHTEVFTALGEHGLAAEAVARAACKAAQTYLASGAAVGEYLADQLLLPFALAKGGAFTTHSPSQHTMTNAQVIEKFLPVEFDITPDANKVFTVSVLA